MFTPEDLKEKKINVDELMGMLYMINSKLDMLLVQNGTVDKQAEENEKEQGKYKKKPEEPTYMG